jgi:hypothetical protein
MTDEHKFAFSRRKAPELFHQPRPSKQREQGMPGVAKGVHFTAPPEKQEWGGTLAHFGTLP